MAGIPIAVSTSLAIEMPCAMTRKLTGVRSPADFSYGEHNNIEGQISDGDEIVLVDDLVTKFDSKKIALLQLDAETKRRGLANVRCGHVVVFFDREQGARKAAADEGITLHSVVPFLSMGLPILKGQMAAREYEVISEYLRDPARFQGEGAKALLRNEALESRAGVSAISGV